METYRMPYGPNGKERLSNRGAYILQVKFSGLYVLPTNLHGALRKSIGSHMDSMAREGFP